MKNIKIFVASSITEFEKERKELGFFIGGINDILKQQDIECKLLFCENEDHAMSASERKQDDYNALIRDSDAVFVLFFRSGGRFTLEEMEFAYSCFRANSRPKVYVYFRDFDESALSGCARTAHDLLVNTYRHYYNTFENIATVQVDIMRTLFELTKDPALKVTEDEGNIYMGKNLILDADQLDYIKRNKRIGQLKEKLLGLRNRDPEYIDDYSDDEIEDEIRHIEKQLHERYSNCFKALEERYKNISAAAALDPELQAAYNASAKGDYKKVCEILSREDLRLETEKSLAEDRASRKEYYETTFGKYIQLVNALTETYNYDELEAAYTDAIYAIDGLRLYDIEHRCLDTWYGFVSFLCDQNKTPKALSYGERLEKIYSLDSNYSTDYDLAALYNLLGQLYYSQNDPQMTENYFLKATDLMSELAASNPEHYNSDLAGSYNNVGYFYANQGKYKDAENYFLKAIELREALAASNPDRYSGELSASYNNAGVFYDCQGKLEDAESYFLKAIELRESLAASNPDHYNGDLAISYNNVGLFYANIGETDGAEGFFLKAIKLQEALSASNPDRYNSDLAQSYGNIGNFYMDQGNSNEAEGYYLKSIELFQGLVSGGSDCHIGDLASSYNNIGCFYDEKGETDEAEDCFLKAIKLQEALVLSNPGRYNGDLAMSCNNIGSLYKNKGEPDKSESYNLRAIALYESLAASNPDRYNGNLAVSYYNYAELKNDGTYYKKAYDLAKNAMHDPNCRKIVEELKDRF